MSTPANANPWLGRKFNRDMLEKIKEKFLDAWEDDETYGHVASRLDADLLDFLFNCRIEEVDEDDDDTMIIKFRVPATGT